MAHGYQTPRKAKATFDKLAFFKSLSYTPRPNQLLVHQNTADIRVLACGVRWGKSKLAAMEGLSAAIGSVDRSWGWVVAPTYTLADKVFREMLYFSRKFLPEFIINASDAKMKLVLRNIGGELSEICGKTAENPDNLLGEGLDWLIADEAARIKQSVWESYLSQRLLDKNGWALLISTPKGRNWFQRMYARGRSRTERIAAYCYPTADNPLVSAVLLAQAKDELPEDVFRQEFMADFIDSGGSVFRNVDECATGQLRPTKPYSTFVMGVDLAKYRDFTVIVVLDMRGNLVFFDRFNQIDWTLQKARIKSISKQYNNASIVMDSTGVGDPIYEDLRRMECPVSPYQFTEASKKTLIDNLVLAIENRRITYPAIPDLLNELKSFTYTLTDAGRLKRSAPSGEHDDCVIALALAVHALGTSLDMSVITELSTLESIAI